MSRTTGRAFALGLLAGIAVSVVAVVLFGLVGMGQLRLASRARREASARIQGSKPPSQELPSPIVPGSPLLGRVPSGWDLLSVDGQRVPFDHYLGKVVFLNLWSISCKPCLAELPGIERLAASAVDPNTSFLLVSSDAADDLNRYLEQSPSKIPVFRFGKALPEILSSSTYPTTYIIGRDGRIRFRHVGAANWDTAEVRAYLHILSTEPSLERNSPGGPQE